MVNFLKNKISTNFVGQLVYLLVIFCLFSVKINIVGIGEGGIRLDDLLMVPAFGYLLFRAIVINEKFPMYFLYYLSFLIFCVFATLLSASFERVHGLYGLFFIVRLAQYSMFFLIGSYLFKNGYSLEPVLKAYVILLAVLIPLQMMSVIPVPGEFGATRASGNLNGPYELAAVSAFLFFFFYSKRMRNMPFAIISAVVLFLTASRITIFAVAVIVFAVFFRNISSLRQRAVFVGLPALVFLCLFLFNPHDSFTEVDIKGTGFVNRVRSIDLDVFAKSASDFYVNTPVYKKSSDYLDDAYLNSIDIAASLEDDVDSSGIIRFTRWAALLKSTFSQFDTSIFGMGPSFGSIAIDGYLVRLIVETGIVGVFLFFVFFISAYRWSLRGASWIGHYLLALLITSFFIDIFMSYRPMMLLWLALGFDFARRKKEIK